MITENVSSLKIHQLTKEQYERELEAGNIKKNELYLVSEDEEPSGTLHWDDIEGKPFYEEGEETVLFDGDITFSPDGKLKGQTQITYFEIEQGKTYKIDWNGYAYECASKQVELDNGVFVSYLGNAVLLEEEDTGENFLFYCGKDEAGENVSVAAYIPMTEDKIPNERVIPCKIYHDGKIIHKLPNKFIDAEWMANDNAGAITILEEKEYTGGQTFRSYEETAINIQKVVEYESVTVICNGNEYECKPIYDEDDGSGEGDVFFLGNAGMWSEKYPNTGEPFMLMAYIGGAVILGVATEEPYTFGIKKKNIIPIPLKYLPKGYGYLGEKGKEEIIFESEVTLEDEDGAGIGLIDATIEFIEGDMYVLQLGETEYECVAKSLTQTMDGVTATATWIGNAGIMGMENTGEPFLVVTQPMGQDENGNLTYRTILVTEVFLDENVPAKITHIKKGTPTIPFDEALIPPTIARKEDLQNLGGGSSNDLRLIKTIELAEDVAIIESFTTDDNGEEFDLEEIVIISDNLALADGVTDNNASWRVWVYTRNSYWDSNNSDIFGSNTYIEPYLCTSAAMAFFCNIKIIDEYNLALVKTNDKNGNVSTKSMKTIGNHIQRISFKSNNHNTTLFKAGSIIKVYGR